jgi:hypothetical protein
MLLPDDLIIIGIGALFIIVGLIAFGWGRREESTYNNYLSHLDDVREFLTHWPERPEPQGLFVGGWISVAVGLLLIILGLAFLLSR